MNINFSKSVQIPQIINKFCTNPINFKGRSKQDCLELQKLTPEAEAQYQEQKAQTNAEIKAYLERKSYLEARKSACEEEKVFYEDIINPDKPYYQQLNDLIETLKPFEAQEEEYKAKRQEVHDCITYNAFMEPNWRENIIRILNKYKPDYQTSKDSKSTSKTFLKALVLETMKELDNDYNDKREKELSRFSQSCNRILISYFSDKQKDTEDIYSSWRNHVITTAFDSGNINSLNERITNCNKEINYYNSDISDLNKGIERLKEKLLLYRKYLVSNPQTAPFYKPFQNEDQTYQELIRSGFCIDAEDILDEHFDNSYLKELKNMGLIKLLPTWNYTLVDLTDETSIQTTQTLKAKKGKLRSLKQIKKEYNLPESYIINANLPMIEFVSRNKDYNKSLTFFEIDDTSEKSLEEQIARYQRTKCVPMDKYYCKGFSTPPKERFISATLLKKLGFFSANGLIQLVKNGKLEGYIKQVETKQGPKTQAYIDLSVPENIDKLTELRDKNKTTLSLSEFAKASGISQKNLMENIKDGNVDIIKDIILNMDLDHIYIDLNVEKNRQFLFEKEFEQQLKREQTQQERQEKELQRINNKDLREKYASLRMKLVWYFCPKTKQIASQMASKDGYLCKLLEKDTNDEELTQHEKIKINSYRKNLWLTAGNDELKEGFKKANEILKQLNNSGVDSIDDEEIRNIIKMYS